MIPVDSLLYKIDQKLNKLSTNSHQQIPLEDKILALNEAQISLIKTKMSGITVPTKIGFDGTKKRYEDIQNLIVDFTDKSLSLDLVNKSLNQWECSLASLDPKYMFYVDSYILATKGKCKNHTIWINKELAKHGDIQFLLTNSNYKPSFEYQETFNTISDDKLSVFTDGSFTPTKIYLMYVKYPQYIDKAGYEKFDGNNSVDADCELVDYLEDELLDLTIRNIAMYTENNSAMQSAQYRINTSE